MDRDCGHRGAPPHALFPRLARVVARYLREKVEPVDPARMVDAFLSPCYDWMVERLGTALRPDPGAGEAAERPRLGTGRGPGSTSEVSFKTLREPFPVCKSHVNVDFPATGTQFRRFARNFPARTAITGSPRSTSWSIGSSSPNAIPNTR